MNGQDLFHWGIPGMRWGVRKDKSSYSSLNSSQRKNAKRLAKVEKQGKTPKMDDDGERLREVTPKELRKRNKLAKKAGLSEQPDIPETVKSKKSSKDDTTRKKTAKEMTTKELWDEVNRAKAEKAYDDMFNPKQENPEKIKLQKAADKAQTTSTVLNTAKGGFDSASNVARTVAAEARKVPSKKVQEELSQMSNKEIQAKIDRIRLERQYAELNPSSQAIAAERTAAVLQGIGNLAAVGGSVASIAAAINQLKARRVD